MNFDIFAPDYGILPSAYFKKNAITNPIELFWSDELLALLRLCGAKEETIGERASDYDRFLSVCRALPLLKGHPTRAWIASILEKHFGLKELPTEETAPNVWKILCENLSENPISPRDLASTDWLCDSLTVPNELPKNITPVLNANLLLETNTKSTAAWSAQIVDTVTHFAASGCPKIVLHLTDGFEFVTPSIYHVDRALSLVKKDRAATNLMTCQLMRELCTAAQKYDLLLVLVCDKNPAAVVRLLQYAEENVGLPRICWSVKEAREALPLITFNAQAHKSEILAALSYDNAINISELMQTLQGWQMRYPVGRLCYITAQDLRQTPYVQIYIKDILLNASKTKI